MKYKFNWPSGPSSVSVSGSFLAHNSSTPLEKQHDGSFAADVTLSPGSYTYHYTVDGERKTDPAVATDRDASGALSNVLEVPATDAVHILPVPETPAPLSADAALLSGPGIVMPQDPYSIPELAVPSSESQDPPAASLDPKGLSVSSVSSKNVDSLAKADSPSNTAAKNVDSLAKADSLQNTAAKNAGFKGLPVVDSEPDKSLLSEIDQTLHSQESAQVKETRPQSSTVSDPSKTVVPDATATGPAPPAPAATNPEPAKKTPESKHADTERAVSTNKSEHAVTDKPAVTDKSENAVTDKPEHARNNNLSDAPLNTKDSHAKHAGDLAAKGESAPAPADTTPPAGTTASAETTAPAPTTAPSAVAEPASTSKPAAKPAAEPAAESAAELAAESERLASKAPAPPPKDEPEVAAPPQPPSKKPETDAATTGTHETKNVERSHSSRAPMRTYVENVRQRVRSVIFPHGFQHEHAGKVPETPVLSDSVTSDNRASRDKPLPDPLENKADTEASDAPETNNKAKTQGTDKPETNDKPKTQGTETQKADIDKPETETNKPETAADTPQADKPETADQARTHGAELLAATSPKQKRRSFFAKIKKVLNKP